MTIEKDIMDKFWADIFKEQKAEIAAVKAAVNKTCIKGPGLFEVLGLDFAGGL